MRRYHLFSVTSLISLSVLALLALSTGFAPPALAGSLVALLKSQKNAESYQFQNIGPFEEDWLSFKRTIDSTNIRYDIVKDTDLAAGPVRLQPYKVIIIPLLVDISPEAAAALQAFIHAGGKILITDGGGTLSAAAAQVAEQAGARIVGHNTIQDSRFLSWSKGNKPFNQEFSLGTLYAEAQAATGAGQLATWTDSTTAQKGAAILSASGNIYLSWAPGLQGETATNAQLLTMCLDEAYPGLSEQAAKQITKTDYVKLQNELEKLRARTETALLTARQADLAVPLLKIQKHYDAGLVQLKAFSDYCRDHKYFEADQALGNARNEFSLAFAFAMPVNAVEARNIWLDRGTIVACQGPQGMSDLFDRLRKAGINTVYFETNNAGFTMFPSQTSTQNPQTAGWDPLGCAVTEAHKRGMEIHAWFWTFSVGNSFHNPIVKLDTDFPGPVLAKTDFALALASQNGFLIPPRQHEFWLDPSAPEARKFIQQLILEAVEKYPVDGIQLDYIRYPFNGKGSEMGFNWSGRVRFERATRLSLDRLNEKTRMAWQKWKTEQISSFVQETSTLIRKLRPGTRISAAVYAMPRAQRLQAIQQDWETWVANGWIDTLNPMTYVTSAEEFSNKAGLVKTTADNKVLSFPGMSIRELDTAAFVEQLNTAREIGSLGTTLFAAAQLDDNKINILRLGPYNKPALMTPQANPLKACTILMDRFSEQLNRYIQHPDRPISASRASTNAILLAVETLQKAFHITDSTTSFEQIANLQQQVSDLGIDLKDLLELDIFAQRSNRAKYISSQLGQIEAILAYKQHALSSRTTSSPQQKTAYEK